MYRNLYLQDCELYICMNISAVWTDLPKPDQCHLPTMWNRQRHPCELLANQHLPQGWPNISKKTSKNISRKIMEHMEDPTQNIPKPSKLDNFAVLSKSQQIASKECQWLFHLPLVLVVFEPLCSVDRSWSCRSNCKMMWNYPCRACISWCACHGPNRIADSWNISWCDFTPSMAIRSISMKAERKSMEKRIHPKRIKKIHKVNKE